VHTTLLPQHRALHTCHHSAHLDGDTYFLPASPARGCLHSHAEDVLRYNPCIPMQMLYSATMPASPAGGCLLLLLADAHFSHMQMPDHLIGIFMLTLLSS